MISKCLYLVLSYFILIKLLLLIHIKEFHNQVNNIKAEYKEKEFDIEWQYKSKIKRFSKRKYSFTQNNR